MQRLHHNWLGYTPMYTQTTLSHSHNNNHDSLQNHCQLNNILREILFRATCSFTYFLLR